MNQLTLRSIVQLFCTSAIALSLGACMITTSKTVVSEPKPVAALSATELRARAETQGQAYKKNPADVKNAYHYAETLGALERHEQQAAVLEKVVMNHGGEPEVMAAYGKSLIALGEYARADQVLAQAYTPDAPDWKILSARGVANDKLGNHADARRFYTEALKIQPEEPSILTNMGLSYAFERNYGQAEAFLRRALAQPGVDSRTQQNLAIVLGLQGKRDEEKQALAKVAGVDDATNAMAAIDGLRNAQERTPRPTVSPAANARTKKPIRSPGSASK